VAQAESLVAEIAAAVSPGAKVTNNGADYGPSDCTAPLSGLVYYSISRQFDAPHGKTGADLVAQLIEQLHAHGYRTDTPNTLGDYVSFEAQTDYVGLDVLAYKQDGLIQINIDTECGAPDDGDTATGVNPSSSSTTPPT